LRSDTDADVDFRASEPEEPAETGLNCSPERGWGVAEVSIASLSLLKRLPEAASVSVDDLDGVKRPPLETGCAAAPKLNFGVDSVSSDTAFSPADFRGKPVVDGPGGSTAFWDGAGAVFGAEGGVDPNWKPVARGSDSVPLDCCEVA
jgi:hypothetical protein